MDDLRVSPAADHCFASPDGHVVSTASGKQRVLSGWVTARGYRHVAVRVGGKAKSVYAHRIVAEAFYGPVPDGLEINHKDGDKLNNMPENLEYVLHGDNVRHAVASGLWPDKSGECNGRAKLSDGDVLSIMEANKAGVSSARLAAAYGVTRGMIWRITTGKAWAHLKCDGKLVAPARLV